MSDDVVLFKELFEVGALDLAEHLLEPSRSFTVASSRSRTSYTLPQTSGTPRSMFSRV